VVHLLLESDLQNAVGLVDDQGLQVLVHKAVGALKVIKEPSWGGNDDIDSLCQLLSLCTPVGSAHNNSVSLLVVLHEF